VVDLAHYFQDLVSGKRQGAADRLLLASLKLVSHLYALILSVRALAYRLGALPSRKLPRPVISVGNITLGGTGKTPMTARLAADLIGRGLRVAVLSRGYGGTANGALRIVSDGSQILLSPEESGDEPYLLARKVPGLMVVIGADRHQAGLLALKELQPDIFILDDGFQHLRLKRDLDLLLLDAAKPFANGYTLPAGFLRERISACRRADLVVYTRSAQAGAPNLFPDKPSLWTSHALSGMVPVSGGETIGLQALQGKRITAFSGIANPASFFDLLESCGVRLTATLSFADHTRYGDQEVAAICRLKTASRSTVLITTEKDAVKLAPHAEKLGACFAVLLEMECADLGVLDTALEKLL
jgi:tetraacyldisaccharide 4'-kinase